MLDYFCGLWGPGLVDRRLVYLFCFIDFILIWNRWLYGNNVWHFVGWIICDEFLFFCLDILWRNGDLQDILLVFIILVCFHSVGLRCRILRGLLPWLKGGSTSMPLCHCRRIYITGSILSWRCNCLAEFIIFLDIVWLVESGWLTF